MDNKTDSLPQIAAQPQPTPMVYKTAMQSNKKRSNLIPFVIVFLIAILVLGGVYFVFNLSSLTGSSLPTKKFKIDDKKYSITIPKSLKQKDEKKESFGTSITFANDQANINKVIISTLNQAHGDSISCTLLKKTKVYTVTVVGFGKEADVCRGEEINGNSSLIMDGIKDGILYDINVTGKKDYLNSTEGKEQAKQILASFKME